MKSIKWQVKTVSPLPDYKLLLSFCDQTIRIYDCKPLLDKGIFKQLKNQSLFEQAHIVASTVAWNEEIDIAPEELYYNSTTIK